MFYPYRTLNDLKIDGSFWKKFNNQRHRYINKKRTKFWTKGFDILQNIEDRLSQQQHVKRARDPISIATINKKPLDSNKTHNDKKNIDQIADILDMGTQSRLVVEIFYVYFKQKRIETLTHFENHIVSLKITIVTMKMIWTLMYQTHTMNTHRMKLLTDAILKTTTL